PSVPNDTPCDDGSKCTDPDTCQFGVCTGQNPVICPPNDSCHDPGTCDPATGICSNPIGNEGGACSDGNLCTLTAFCHSGTCTATSSKVCPPPMQCFDAATCDPSTGNCNYPNSPDGTACDDGNQCTQSDSCVSGACTNSTPAPMGTTCDQNGGTVCDGAGMCVMPNFSRGGVPSGHLGSAELPPPVAFDNGAATSSGAGCSAAPGSPAGPAALLLLLLAIARLRAWSVARASRPARRRRSDRS